MRDRASLQLVSWHLHASLAPSSNKDGRDSAPRFLSIIRPHPPSFTLSLLRPALNASRGCARPTPRLIPPSAMAAAAVDVGYLAASYDVPEPTLHSLLSAPTVELVQDLLAQIEAKAREHDELRSEKLRADVELENAIRGADVRARSLKASADKAIKEVEELRQKLSQEGTYTRAAPNIIVSAD